MPKPTVTSMELSTGDSIPLSFDIETGTPVEILLHGSNLENVTSVQLDSGPDIEWYITGVSAGPNSVYLVAYASGAPGYGGIAVQSANGDVLIDTEGQEFVLPLLD